MTALQISILATLKINHPCPMSDGDLWRYCADQEQGGMATAIVCACLELESVGLILSTDHGWMLTPEGHKEIDSAREEDARHSGGIISSLEKLVDRFAGQTSLPTTSEVSRDGAEREGSALRHSCGGVDGHADEHKTDGQGAAYGQVESRKVGRFGLRTESGCNIPEPKHYQLQVPSSGYQAPPAGISPENLATVTGEYDNGWRGQFLSDYAESLTAPQPIVEILDRKAEDEVTV